MAIPLRERFERKFERTPHGCWIWNAKTKNGGYGIIHVGGRHDGKWLYAHRLSWEFYRDRIPDGLHVLHRCDNPSCVNPDHLFLGTQTENNRDRDRKGRQVAPRGTKNGMAKLDEESIRFIRSSPLSSVKLEKMIGVDHTTICRIRRRERWAHVDA